MAAVVMVAVGWPPRDGGCSASFLSRAIARALLSASGFTTACHNI